MRRRIRWFITADNFCQLLLAVSVLTCGLPAAAQGSDETAAAQSRAATAGASPSGIPSQKLAAPDDQIVIRAREQQKTGDVYTLRGDVEIEYRDRIFRADAATYNAETGEATATGHVTMDGGAHDDHIQGSHAEYNVRTETGRFYDVAGTTGMKFHGKRVALTSSSPFAFTGKVVVKMGPDRYIVYHGTVTSCELPKPKWTFSAHKVVVDVGETAKIYSSAFKIKKVPVFYFPFAEHPVEKLPRQSGFLVPSFGTSNRKGTIVGESFYWAINRSMDALLGAELWSSRGWAQHGSFRAKPSESSYISASYFGVLDRGLEHRNLDQSGQDIRLNGTAYFPHDIRGVGALEYLSSYIFRLGFSETFVQAINSEVKSNAFLTRNWDGISENLRAARYQNFQSTRNGDVVTILHAPSLEVSTADRSIQGSRFFWGFDAAAEGLSRVEPAFRTANLVGRFDLFPRASYSLVADGWTLRPEVGLRDTIYTERRLPTASGFGTTIQQAVNRRLFDASFELRPPAMARIFKKPLFGRRLKHTLEPRGVYHYVQGVENFANIIRFDARDILSDTNDVEIGVVQRLYAKPVSATCNSSDKVKPAGPVDPSAQEKDQERPPVTDTEKANALPVAPPPDCADTMPREIVTWQLGQKYFLSRNFGNAVVPGLRNVFSSTVEFTGVAFLTEPRRLSPVISRLRIHPNLAAGLEWDLDYDAKKGRISSSSTFADYRVQEFFFGAGHTFLQSPGEILVSNPVASPSRFNQFRLLAGFGNPVKRGFTAASTVGFDADRGFAQYIATQTTYNWDCCGVTMEFRRLALGPVRNENQFRFAFTVANVGSFGTLKRQERVY